MTAQLLEESKSGFHKLPLSPALLDALDRANYFKPTPIQGALIPYGLAGRDVIGQAQTGTGKTAAFLLPFLNRWKPVNNPGPQALILAPTRELVIQVAEEARKLCPSKDMHILPIYGGQQMRQQLRALTKGCNLVVGTPGRIIDHLQRGTLTFDYVRYAVLDEADRMLDIGFRDDIEKILRRCPKKRQTMLLSATLPESVLRLANRYLVTPVHIKHASKTVTVDKIDQRYITVAEDRKYSLLLKVLEMEKPRQAIIFCERKRRAEALGLQLYKLYPATSMMHGDLPQPKREKIMQRFREGKLTYLVATDVVGRGIDVMGISHIINYDLPHDVDSYVHRIGRTGRMGADGVAISFVTPEQGKELTAIEGHINKLIEPVELEGFAAVPPPREKKEEAPPAPKQPVYGRRTKKYSNRL